MCGDLWGPKWSPPPPHPRRQCQSPLPGEKIWKIMFFLMNCCNLYEFVLENGTKMITSCSICRVGGCMDGWMYGCMYVWMDGWMDACMYGCMDVWMYGWMSVCMDVWMDGCMDVSMYVCMYGRMDLYDLIQRYFDELFRTRKMISESVLRFLF